MYKINKLTIRPELQTEYKKLYDFIQEAFRTATVADGNEQNFVQRLREYKGYRPDLALVAEYNGEIVGYLMLTEIQLDDSTKTLLLAPLCVQYEARNLGIGTRLVQEGFLRATKTGGRIVIVVGDPNYYKRFGFRKSSECGIYNRDAIPDKYVQVAELVKGACSGLDTTISFRSL